MKLSSQAEKAYFEDTATRWKSLLTKKETWEEKLRKLIERDEIDMPDPIDRSLRGDTYHLPYRLTLASVRAFAKDMVWAMIP